MNLETLPPEVLSDICGYIGYSDVTSLSFVSKRIRAVALKFILRGLRVSFPGDKFKAISKFFRQSSNGRHVRSLVLDAEETNQTTWRRLIRFLRCLTGLKSVECQEDVALFLLKSWAQLRQCELFVRGFQMRGGLQREDYQRDPKFRLLTASCLTSLECDVSMRDLPRGRKVLNGDEDEEDEGDDEGAADELDQDMLRAQAESLHIAKVVSFLTTVVPNLRRLDLIRNYWYGSIKIPKRRAKRANLVHLDLSGLGNPQPMLFKHLQQCTDFAVLESLSLPDMSELTYKWLFWNPMSLPRLKELKMHVLRGFPGNEEYFSSTMPESILLNMNVPPLKKLKLVGDYFHALGNCAEYHSTLESLTLHHMDDEIDEIFTGFGMLFFELILPFENLTFLDIQVHRSRRDGEMLKMLQSSRLETLILTLYCQLMRDWTVKQRKEVLELAAIDETLARSIYEVCGLEYLMVTTNSNQVPTFYREDSATVRVVLEELTGSYEVTRVEGHVHVVKMASGMAREMFPGDENAFKLDSNIMDIFRSIWPSKGGDWRDDWHSLPLVVDT